MKKHLPIKRNGLEETPKTRKIKTRARIPTIIIVEFIFPPYE